jgi:hypothetical protein
MIVAEPSAQPEGRQAGPRQKSRRREPTRAHEHAHPGIVNVMADPSSIDFELRAFFALPRSLE